MPCWCCYLYAKICVKIQSSSSNIDLKYIPKELLAVAGVVGAVVMVQTGADVNQSKNNDMFVRWSDEKS